MDLVAEMLLDHVGMEAPEVRADRLQPSMRRRFSPVRPQAELEVGDRRRFTLDRLLNRFWDYPRYLEGVRPGFDVFHVVDQAYAQLVHSLPRARTVLTCHDLHTFRSLLDPAAPSRSAAFRWMTRRTLEGLKAAALVAVDTGAVGDQLVEREIVPRERIRVAHLGVDTVFSHLPEGEDDLEAERILGGIGAADVLHVGGTFHRKRIDHVLEIFAGVRAILPEARLVRVGGALTTDQSELASKLGISGSIVTVPFTSRRVLAAVYRRSSLLILPSEEEGFGFPVIEAQRSGTPVVASDLAVLREVGGDAVVYRPVGKVDDWISTVVQLLREARDRPEVWQARRNAGIVNASRFTWQAYARRMADMYLEVASS